MRYVYRDHAVCIAQKLSLTKAGQLNQWERAASRRGGAARGARGVVKDVRRHTWTCAPDGLGRGPALGGGGCRNF
eukprot:5874424-Prymnesium_polylepis.1